MAGEEASPLLGKKRISIEPKLDFLVDVMYWHVEAFNATSESQLKNAYDLLQKSSGGWKRLRAMDCDEDEMHKGVDAWCGTLAGEDNKNAWKWEAKADYKTQKWKHLDMLKQVWQDNTFGKCISKILYHLGPKHSLKFLKSLCVRVPDDVISAKLYQFMEYGCPVKVVPGDLSNKGTGAFLEGLVNVAEEYPSPPSWLYSFGQKAHRSRVVCFYTAIQGVFESNPSDMECVRISQGIIACSEMLDYHFASPFGQAIVACNWAFAYPYFVCHRVADLIFQILLMMYLTPATRSPVSCDDMESRLWKDEFARVGPLAITAPSAIAYFGLRNGANLLIELATVMGPIISSRRAPLLRVGMFFVQPYPLFCYMVEVTSIVFSIAFLTDTGYICKKPFHLTGLIFVKWGQLMVSFLNVSFLCEHMLPAWAAMTSKQSRVFLVYMILVAMATSMAYYALPVEGPQTGNDTIGQALEAFVRTFRLDFLTDYDEAEFEGIGHVIRDGRIEDEDNEDAGSFHWMLKIYILICGLIFPVMFLNLYVGLLGEVYSNALKHDVHLKGAFQMNTSSRLLVQRYFWKTWCGGIFNWCWGIFSLTYFDRFSNVFVKRGEEHDDSGIWIIIPEEGMDEMVQEGEEAMYSSIPEDARLSARRESIHEKAKEADNVMEPVTKAAEDAEGMSEEAKTAAESMKDLLRTVSTVSRQLDDLSEAQKELKEEVKQLKGAVSAANSQPKAGCFPGSRSGAPRAPA